MIKSLSVSSESSLPSLEDDSDSVYSDELLGSQSRRWLADLLTGDLHVDNEDVKLGRTGCSWTTSSLWESWSCRPGSSGSDQW
ncbi:hypothetical protein KUCAC02_005959 [Chaenocephalus aceratus]|uniref:Uncharacterized protein n=1 Tax=Chaenocephalus aceratus TaxID=36190 RepID=A0ACB9WPV1_CHAAC|nr:hypothetical protein KUCAC02_005959 [Chaenocephalus aceratus]